MFVIGIVSAACLLCVLFVLLFISMNENNSRSNNEIMIFIGLLAYIAVSTLI